MTLIHLGGELTFDADFSSRFLIVATDPNGAVTIARQTGSRAVARTAYDTLDAEPRWLLDRDDRDDHVVATTFAAIELPDELPSPPDVLPKKSVRPRIEHDPDHPNHGTATGYRANQCRCPRCREANTIAQRAAREAKRR